MSAMPDCTDLPDDPTALARIAVNGSESQDLRNAAWQKLIPIINRIAIDAARAYHCQEIEQEAVGYIWQKLQEGKFEPEKGRFDAWASVVLHHLAADLRKQFSRRLLHSAQQIDSLIEEIPDGRATGTGAAGDAFAQQLDRLPSGLDPGATARSRPIPEQRPTKGARGGRPRRPPYRQIDPRGRALDELACRGCGGVYKTPKINAHNCRTTFGISKRLPTPTGGDSCDSPIGRGPETRPPFLLAP